MNFPIGVEYLSSEKFLAATHVGLSSGAIIGFLIGIIGIVFFVIGLKKDIDFVGITGCGFLVIGFIFGFVSFFLNPVYQTQYLVKIDDDVPYSQIIENYQIVEQRENITILRPIEPLLWEDAE